MKQELVHVEAPDTLRLQRVLPGPIERVWAFLTESEKRGSWLAEGPMELQVGGNVQLTWVNSRLSPEPTPARFASSEGHSMQGRVLACDAPRVLEFTWPQHGEETRVRFELEARGSDVLFTLTHSGLSRREQRVNVASGWDAHVGVLAQRLAGTEPVAFWSRFAHAETEYEASL